MICIKCDDWSNGCEWKVVAMIYHQSPSQRLSCCQVITNNIRFSICTSILLLWYMKHSSPTCFLFTWNCDRECSQTRQLCWCMEVTFVLRFRCLQVPCRQTAFDTPVKEMLKKAKAKNSEFLTVEKQVLPSIKSSPVEQRSQLEAS